MLENNRILIINHDEPVSRFLREKLIVDPHYSCRFEPGVKSGLDVFKENNFDIVIVNFGIPGLDRAGLIKELKRIDPDCHIIALIDESDPSALREVTKSGIYDFITKPVNLEKLLFLIRKGAELHSLTLAHRKLTQSLQEQNMALQKQNILLAKRIEESTKNLARLYEDLRSTYLRTIKALAQAIDARDHYTHSHSETVVKYAVALAEQLGLSAKEIEIIREACELHDLGKIGIEDKILTKPASLTPEEWKQIKCHPVTGAQILEPLTFLQDVVELVRQHHEHYDGSGYPDGRRGEDILLGARIIHLADAYESMRSPRSYRKTPFTKQEAIEEIKKNSGRQFDPKVVEAFLQIVDKL